MEFEINKKNNHPDHKEVLHKIPSHQSSTNANTFAGGIFLKILTQITRQLGKREGSPPEENQSQKTEVAEIQLVKETEAHKSQADNRNLLNFVGILLRNQKKMENHLP